MAPLAQLGASENWARFSFVNEFNCSGSRSQARLFCYTYNVLFIADLFFLWNYYFMMEPNLMVDRTAYSRKTGQRTHSVRVIAFLVNNVKKLDFPRSRERNTCAAHKNNNLKAQA